MLRVAHTSTHTLGLIYIYIYIYIYRPKAQAYPSQSYNKYLNVDRHLDRGLRAIRKQLLWCTTTLHRGGSLEENALFRPEQ